MQELVMSSANIVERLVKIIEDYEQDNLNTIDKLKRDKKIEMNRINGALKQTIQAHGPITKELIGSASKRIWGALLSNEKSRKMKDRGKFMVIVMGVVLIIELIRFMVK